jgi:hypothetical protein
MNRDRKRTPFPTSADPKHPGCPRTVRELTEEETPQEKDEAMTGRNAS